MHTFCNNILLIAGGVIDVGAPFVICLGQGPCPHKNKACHIFCDRNGFHKGGYCSFDKCCCNGGGPPQGRQLYIPPPSK